MSDGKDDQQEIGSGKSPEGAPVTYHETYRPETIGALGSTGVIVVVKDASGKKVTHSDSLEGLKKCGYTVDGPSAPSAASAAAEVPAPSLEEQL